MTRNVDRIAVNGAEAAQMLGISEAMVRKLDAQGVIQSASLGRCKRYLIEDIKALFRKREESRDGRNAAQAG